MRNISKTDQREMYRMFEKLTKDFLDVHNTFSLYVTGESIPASLIVRTNKNLDKFKSYLEDGIK